MRSFAWTAASAMLAAVVVSGCADSPSADGARFTLAPVTTLGDTAGPGALSSVPSVSPRIASRWYFVTTPWDAREHAPRRFASANGAFEAVLGDAQLGQVEMVHASGDTLLLHDLNQKRMAFVAAPDSLLRVVDWPHRPFSLLELADGSFVLSTGDFSAAPPMLHVSRAGVLLGEFGPHIETPNTESRYRLFARAKDGGFWSARVSRQLELQRWASPGALTETLALTADWFPRYEREARFGPGVPPSPMLVAFWEDDEGMLWLVGAAPDPQWAEGLGAAVAVEGGVEYYPVLRPDETFDTIIERWDPVKRERLWSERLDAFYYASPEPWTLLRASGNTGVRQIGVWRVQVR